MALCCAERPFLFLEVFNLNDLIQYFVGAICPIFDNVMIDWKTHTEIVCVYGSAVCLMGLVTLWTLLGTIKACITAFAHHVGGGSRV